MAYVHILENEEEGSRFAFEEITKPFWSEVQMLGLASDSMLIQLYGLMIWAFQQRLISFRDLLTVNVGEYVGLSPGHSQSHWTFIWNHLFKWVDARQENVMIPFGGITFGDELTRVCSEMEEWIASKGPVGLWILGIGVDGQIGFCEPGMPADSRYHVAELTEPTAVPKQAITAGIATIKESKCILLVAWGGERELECSASLLGPMTVWTPSSLLQKHRNLHVVLDQEAGKGILSFICTKNIKPNDKDVYLVRSEAGITHRVRVGSSVRDNFSLPRNYRSCRSERRP